MIDQVNMITLKQILKTVLVIVIFFISITTLKAQNGEAIFKNACAACHKIGGGNLIGPDLNGITTLRNEAWLIKWIKSSQSLISSGDADAIAVFEAYNKIPMPDQNFSDVEIKEVLAYIQSKSTTGAASAAATTTNTETQVSIKSSDKATENEILLGQHLFEGSARLTNGGPTCVSCHNIATSRIIPGGLLAKDLTTVFSRMGGDAGITAIMNAPPFPAMTEAYKNKQITKDEIFAITSFLNKVQNESGAQQLGTIASISPLLKYGFIGFAIWVCIILFLWRSRKQSMVKQKIFDRQVKTH